MEDIAAVRQQPTAPIRKQVHAAAKRHCRTEAEARKELAELQNKAISGTYLSPSKITVEQICANYIADNYNSRESPLINVAYDLAPLRERHGTCTHPHVATGW